MEIARALRQINYHQLAGDIESIDKTGNDNQCHDIACVCDNTYIVIGIIVHVTSILIIL